jgi:arginyl-tRNA synthetase
VVEVQNYIDNTGVQVADVVVGFVHLEDRDLESIKKLDADLALKVKALTTIVGTFTQGRPGVSAKRPI